MIKFAERIKFGGLIAIFISLLAVASFMGCSSGDGGIADWNIGQTTAVTSVNVKGKILAPEFTASSSRMAIALPSLEGTRVFVESNPALYADADAEGNFYIPNVPATAQRFVAYKTYAGFNYRQRSPVYQLNGNYETQILQNDIKLAEANYNVSIHVSDINTGQSVYAKATIWGFTEQAVNGWLNLGPFPNSLGEEILIEAVGYKPYKLSLGFNEKSNSEIYIKLTPLSSVTGNSAPLAEILCESKEVGTGDYVALAASGIDPDGDFIKWSWKSDSGSFTNMEGVSTLFIAPFATGTSVIEVTATDPEGAVGRAVLKLPVVKSSKNHTKENNRAPNSPETPTPANNSTNQGGEITLRWVCSDPDGDSLKYDVYFANQGSNLVLVAENLLEPAYTVTNLSAYTTYTWQIIARDTNLQHTSSQIWYFSTGDLNNNAPYKPSNPTPANGSNGWSDSVNFTWVGGDPDTTDIITYSLFYGDQADNMIVHGSTTNTNFQVNGFEFGKTYYWKIISADNRGKSTESDIWSFTTRRPDNSRPNNPEAILPENGATDVSRGTGLQWAATDPDGDSLKYDIYFGQEANNLNRLAASISDSYYVFTETLSNNTKYFWQVVVTDTNGLSNENSPVWSFTTTSSSNSNPNRAVAITPSPGATTEDKPVISWNCTDPDNDTLTYDLYLSRTQPFTLEHVVASDISETSWTQTTSLTSGAEYFWQVIAKDPYGGKSVSDVFNFWVRASGNIDIEPPSIVSITPANNSNTAETTDNVIVVFSEPVVKSTAEAGFTFTPTVAGAWVWQNETTAKFTPTEAWVAGSWHKFTVADNSIQDLSGNQMGRGTSVEFTIKTDVPVPVGYKSVGMPVNISRGETKTVSIHSSGTGRSLYALAVAGSKSGSVSVSAKKIGEEEDFHTKLRRLEREIKPNREFNNKLVKAKKEVLASGVDNTIKVGDERYFYLLNDSSTVTRPRERISTVCKAITTNFLIYMDKDITSLNDTYFAGMADKCENVINPALVNAFGYGPPSGPDGETRTIILITNKIQSNVLGFFYFVDLNDRKLLDSYYRYSNECKIIYLNSSISNEITRYGTIAHEMQHMINYHNKIGSVNSPEDTWLNEGLSKYAEEITGFGIADGDDNTVSLIKRSQQKFNNLSVTNWEDTDSYGLSYLFVKFLARDGKYKTTARDMTRSLLQNPAISISNVEMATNESFQTTLAKWGLSLYLNDYSNSDANAYGIYGLNLKGTYNGVTMPGFQWSSAMLEPTVSLKAYGICGFRYISGVSGDLTMTITPTQEIKAYYFDERK